MSAALFAVVNDWLAGVCSVYLATRSVAVTVIAATATVLLAGLLAFRG